MSLEDETPDEFLHYAVASGLDDGSLDEDEFDDDDVGLAEFLEAEVMSLDDDPPPATGQASDEASVQEPQVEASRPVRQRVEDAGKSPSVISTGNFGNIPVELFPNILKFLSSQDLCTCAGVCQFLRLATSDESLWRRLYSLRWGPRPQADQKGKPRGWPWKKLYFERDQADMVDFARNTPSEFREYYIQMQAAKRSQAPIPSQIHDDLVVIDTTAADQITAWRRSHKLPDVYDGNHSCSGQTCSYYQIGDIFLCEKTGRAHVCDETCPETVLDPSNELLVCTVSGRCFDHWLDGDDDDDETTPSRHQAESIAAAEEGEMYMNAGRLGRAYLLGYNCADEKELDAALRC